MKASKRYSVRQAQLLLARVMAVLSVPDAPIAKKRRMYLDLLQARFSDIVVAESVREYRRTDNGNDNLPWQPLSQVRLAGAALVVHAVGAWLFLWSIYFRSELHARG